MKGTLNELGKRHFHIVERQPFASVDEAFEYAHRHLKMAESFTNKYSIGTEFANVIHALADIAYRLKIDLDEEVDFMTDEYLPRLEDLDAEIR